MTRDAIVEMLTEIYPREQAQERVVQTTPSSAQVNCEIHKRYWKAKIKPPEGEILRDAKAVFASNNVEYQVQDDGNIVVALDEPVTAEL